MNRYFILFLFYLFLIVLGPGLWDGFEFQFGVIGKQMHKVHNNPDILPHIPWNQYSVFNAMQSGWKVSWFLTIPAVMILAFCVYAGSEEKAMAIAHSLIIHSYYYLHGFLSFFAALGAILMIKFNSSLYANRRR